MRCGASAHEGWPMITVESLTRRYAGFTADTQREGVAA